MADSRIRQTEVSEGVAKSFEDLNNASFDSGYQPSDSIDIEEMIGSEDTTTTENGFHHQAEVTARPHRIEKLSRVPVSMTPAKQVYYMKNQTSFEEKETKKRVEDPSLKADCAKDTNVCTISPLQNDIKEGKIDSKINDEKKEVEDPVEKITVAMLSETAESVRHRVTAQSTTSAPEKTVGQNSELVCPVLKEAVVEEKSAMEKSELQHVAQQEDCYLAPELKEIEQMEEEAKKTEYKLEYVWVNVAIQIALHIGAFYGLYLAFTAASWKTNLWMVAMTLYAGNSITAGAHRMWCHKAYKANFGVRLFYMIGTTMSIQNDVIEWSRDHRVHHKWADSDADPHNINRGFFFSHMGWLMVRKHPKVKEMGKKVDMSDLEADPLLAFQRRHYVPLIFLSLYFLSAVPVYCWGETWNNAYFVGAILRLALQLHGTWFINSAAHTFGYKPFDTKITAVDTFFYACLTNGEAWHNYHHTFPQDYRASEYMWKGNMSAAMIDFFAYMGWVWDRKTMSKEAIERQKMKGDHSRPIPAARLSVMEETKTNRIHHVAKWDDCYLATELKEIEQMDEEAKKKEYKMEIVWVNVAIQLALHIGAFIGLYQFIFVASWKTFWWTVLMVFYATNSVTAGAHRLWTHKAYKANFWVQLFYMIGDTIAVENDVIEWARDHRCHHKWSDSDADPHNITRGFFFAHMGWLMVKKHPKVKEMGAKIDMSDLESNPILAFQRRHYYKLIAVTQFFLWIVPVYFWNESIYVSFYVACNFRLAAQLHGTWFINSLAHTYGYKPFDTKITPVDNYLYSILANGEAWHNYHHTFPQDYRASEYIWKANFSAFMIDCFASMGWVWDRKTMSKEAIERQKQKGDQSRPLTAAHDD